MVRFGPQDPPKKTFTNIFLVLAVLLLILPFLITFNEFLTRIIEGVGFYRFIQEFVVPYQVRLVQVILALLGINLTATPNGFIANNASVYLSWNCLGWQSIILLVLTLFTGLSGRYTFSSKVETLLIGFFGTFLVNIFRIALVVLIAIYFGKLGAYVFHTYLATLASIVWFFFFWWFSYSFVFEKKNAN